MKQVARFLAAVVISGLAFTGGARGQAFPPDDKFIPGTQGSSNIHVLSHIPLGRAFSGTDLEIEQEPSRPYVYTSVMHQTGTNIISIKDPARAVILWEWRMPNSELHTGYGAMDNKYFKLKGRYYDVQSLQFGVQGPDNEVGAHVIDVTGLPDTSRIKDLGFIRYPDAPNGFHNIFAYKHSDGRVLLFTSVAGKPYGNVYDMEKFVTADPTQGLIGRVANPSTTTENGWHDFYVAYDPATHRDILYGAGAGGYHVIDVSQPEQPKVLTSIVGAAGVARGHTFTPDPTGRYAVAETEYQYAPLRIFDLKPGLDGTVKAITRPIGAWTARWKGLAHNHEVRWPYVFVSAYEDGLQVFNMMDPTNPYTVAYYDTYDGPNQHGHGSRAPDWGGSPDPMTWGVTNGGFGVDVRNSDGLIVFEDFTTGFWAFKMDGFDGWNGHQWGMPNISSAQDWDNGPEGAPKPQRVS